MEVFSACRADSGKVDDGMLVDDIRADGNMVGGRDPTLEGVVAYIDIAVRKAPRMRVHIEAQCLAIAKTLTRTILDGLVHPAAGLFPHAE